MTALPMDLGVIIPSWRGPFKSQFNVRKELRTLCPFVLIRVKSPRLLMMEVLGNFSGLGFGVSGKFALRLFGCETFTTLFATAGDDGASFFGAFASEKSELAFSPSFRGMICGFHRKGQG